MEVLNHSQPSSVVLKLIQRHKAALVLFDLLLLYGCGEHLPLGVNASLIIADLLLICAAARWEKLLMLLVCLLGAILSTGSGAFSWGWCLL